MYFKALLTGGLSALVLSLSTFSFALNNKVLCPPVDMVVESAKNLDTVQWIHEPEEYYNVYADRESIWVENRDWLAMGATDGATDFNSAYSIAVASVKSSANPQDKYAENIEDFFYFCKYLDLSGKLVAATVTLYDGDGTDNNMKKKQAAALIHSLIKRRV